MKNINYDLTKLLHTTLDTIWRLEKHYMEDAKKAKCHSILAFKKVLQDEKKHADMLKKEIEVRMKKGIFD